MPDEGLVATEAPVDSAVESPVESTPACASTAARDTDMTRLYAPRLERYGPCLWILLTLNDGSEVDGAIDTDLLKLNEPGHHVTMRIKPHVSLSIPFTQIAKAKIISVIGRGNGLKQKERKCLMKH